MFALFIDSSVQKSCADRNQIDKDRCRLLKKYIFNILFQHCNKSFLSCQWKEKQSLLGLDWLVLNLSSSVHLQTVSAELSLLSNSAELVHIVVRRKVTNLTNFSQSQQPFISWDLFFSGIRRVEGITTLGS